MGQWTGPFSAFLLFLTSGCAYVGGGRSFDPIHSSSEFTLLRGIDVLHQESQADCGPTALAMVLCYWGEQVSLEELKEELSGSSSSGVTAKELSACAAGRGFECYVVRGTSEDIREHLSKGRPTIVGLVKPYRDRPKPHFAVVAGMTRDGVPIATIDPAWGWTQYSMQDFMREWQPAGNLLMIVGRGISIDNGSTRCEAK